MSITKSEPIISTYDQSIFQGYSFSIGKTSWNVVTRTTKDGGKSDVRVRKTYPNPFGGLGKEFDNFDEAVSNYKNPSLKMNLRLIEIGI